MSYASDQRRWLKATGVKVGDRVQIISVPTAEQLGVKPPFVLGNVCKVRSIDSYDDEYDLSYSSIDEELGIELQRKADGVTCWFPFWCLVKIDKEEE